MRRNYTIRYFEKEVVMRYLLMFFKYPADVKNTAFLTYDYKDDGKEDDQWLYLPAMRKTKRIASGDKSCPMRFFPFKVWNVGVEPLSVHKAVAAMQDTMGRFYDECYTPENRTGFDGGDWSGPDPCGLTAGWKGGRCLAGLRRRRGESDKQ
jgi:hypothetical protein